VLELAGEYDVSTAPDIDAAFAPIEASGTTVVVEFAQASFVDSSVVGALINRSRSGETLLVVAPRGSAVRRTLDLTGVTDALRTFETRDEALQAVPPQDATA
jgi:anti-sigma B factor antagonist